MRGLDEINKLNEIAATQGDRAVLALVNRGVSIDMNLKARKKRAEKEEMREYLVTWEIQVKACTHREAAEEALKVQRDPDSIATVFFVVEQDEQQSGKQIDLLEEVDTDEA